ncbi:DUF1292 domain-containing protein [Proteiniclasticum sp. QWL-01]|uniref:DUF1292 domain-containing protein n=1 Tax=Proteiniclasticum sp. QWL-01 TaxID=3036945 RepID=UPI0021FEEE23|nr:DUF1292 domain-containing protein [Proteiniclasticum sp. QWL-01]UUM10674.1 DUF1292 domain-containing protein [Clostridiaceae bacterium HFYG-1003]WFF72006.1 DUF1292 domain-containing protein [Proteiniclasticum sp. QWL-01]
MEEKNIMKFKDEEGNLIELEAVARIFLEEQEYLILAPLGSDEDEFVLRVDRSAEGTEEFNALDSDEEFLKVKKEYSRLLYDEGKGGAHE